MHVLPVSILTLHVVVGESTADHLFPAASKSCGTAIWWIPLAFRASFPQIHALHACKSLPANSCYEAHFDEVAQEPWSGGMRLQCGEVREVQRITENALFLRKLQVSLHAAM